MTTSELKDILIHKISAINDKSFLSAIKVIVDAKSEKLIYRTTTEQRNIISESRKQIRKGDYLTNDQVQSEVDQWLNEE